MRIEAQAPILGAALVGGMAQSYLIKKYPDWSWMMSLALIGGGVILGMRSGIMESIGVGIAAAGASGLGTGLVPVETAGRMGAGRQMGSIQQTALGRQVGNSLRGAPVMMPLGATGYAPKPEFQTVGIS